MADFGDIAGNINELHTEQALKAAVAAAKRHRDTLLHYSGTCMNCSETIDTGRFCDPDCRRDFELRTRR